MSRPYLATWHAPSYNIMCPAASGNTSGIYIPHNFESLDGLLIDWLTGRLAVWLTDCQTDWMTVWLTGWMKTCLTGWLTKALKPDQVNYWLTDWLTKLRFKIQVARRASEPERTARCTGVLQQFGGQHRWSKQDAGQDSYTCQGHGRLLCWPEDMQGLSS